MVYRSGAARRNVVGWVRRVTAPQLSGAKKDLDIELATAGLL